MALAASKSRLLTLGVRSSVLLIISVVVVVVVAGPRPSPVMGCP